jgi:hypothetical protein
VPRILGVELVAVHLGRDRDGARGGHGEESTARPRAGPPGSRDGRIARIVREGMAHPESSTARSGLSAVARWS